VKTVVLFDDMVWLWLCVITQNTNNASVDQNEANGGRGWLVLRVERFRVIRLFLLV
jgi:hypothetical protein